MTLNKTPGHLNARYSTIVFSSIPFNNKNFYEGSLLYSEEAQQTFYFNIIFSLDLD